MCDGRMFNHFLMRVMGNSAPGIDPGQATGPSHDIHHSHTHLITSSYLGIPVFERWKETWESEGNWHWKALSLEYNRGGYTWNKRVKAKTFPKRKINLFVSAKRVQVSEVDHHRFSLTYSVCCRRKKVWSRKANMSWHFYSSLLF